MAYDENIRIIAEELERLKNRPTGDTLPEVESTDEGKVLTVNSSGEWDAEELPNQLPDVETTDEGKVLSVNSSGEWVAADPSSSYNLDYSTNEINTGQKWLDGKSIYQKTLSNVSITDGTQWINLGIDIADTIISIEGFLNQNNNDFIILPSSDPQAPIGISQFSEQVSGNWSVLFRTTNTDARGTATITVKYVKHTQAEAKKKKSTK